MLDFLESVALPAEETMSDEALAALLERHAAQAVGEEWGEIAEAQERAINYYYHRMPDLPPMDGSSAVVTDTVQVTVDDAMAQVLKPFVSAEAFAQFEAVGPEDVAQAEQANEYVNYVLHCDNPGFLILHNWFKDALLTKIGVTKLWWKDSSGIRRVAANAEELLLARADPAYAGEEDNGDGTWTVALVEPDGRVVIDVIPPEEFRISPYARSIEEAAYTAHAPNNVTRSDLVEMGYDRETVDALPAWMGSGSEEGRREARYRDERPGAGDLQIGSPHPSREIVAFREEYIRVDHDGDGVAELRKVHRVGEVILLNEAVSDHPFALLCPKPMPHKVYGVSLADDTIELQKVETVLWRQTLDNLYKSNNPRPLVGEAAERSDGTTLDSLSDARPGAAVYVRQGEALNFLEVPFTADKSFPMMQMIEAKRSARTGFQAMGNGLDRDVLDKARTMTATQASMVEDKANSRAEMIARIFAETGVKRLMKLILRLLIDHQPKARMIRLRNQWVEVDPRGWNPEMDLKINVGLGFGNKADQVQQASALLDVMQRVAATPFASLVGVEQVHKAMRRFVQAVGIKNADEYIGAPAAGAPPAEPVDPEMEKLRAEQQIAAARIELARQESAAKIQLARDRAAAETQLAREKAALEAELAEQRMQQEIVLAERRVSLAQARRGSGVGGDALPRNHPGGDLSE